MAQHGEELYVDDILNGLEVPPDLLDQAIAAEQNSFSARLRRVRENLGISPSGITQVRIPSDAGYTDILVAPSRLPGFDPSTAIERWIFAVPGHHPEDFTRDTTTVADIIAIPDGEPLERVFGWYTVRPRIHFVEDFRSEYAPHLEIGRVATDQVELYRGTEYESVLKARAILDMGNMPESLFLDKITGIPASCAEVVTSELEIHDI